MFREWIQFSSHRRQSVPISTATRIGTRTQVSRAQSMRKVRYAAITAISMAHGVGTPILGKKRLTPQTTKIRHRPAMRRVSISRYSPRSRRRLDALRHVISWIADNRANSVRPHGNPRPSFGLMRQQGSCALYGLQCLKLGSLQLFASAFPSDQIVHASIMLGRSRHKPLGRTRCVILLSVILFH